MKKAQAFDTFQLMIAAVIAVAILGILLSIIGQIFIPSQRPIQVMQEKLTDAYQYEGAIFTSATKATFQKGDAVPMSIFTKNTGGITPTLQCADFISSGNLANCATSVEVLSTFDAVVSTCCSGSECWVYVGETITNCPP